MCFKESYISKSIICIHTKVTIFLQRCGLLTKLQAKIFNTITILPRTASTSTMDTFDNPALLQFAFRDPANTVCSKIRIPSLYTPQTTQIFITSFFPLSYKVCISYFLIQTVLIKLSADCLTSVEQIVDVTRLLVMNFENRPKRFLLAFPFVRFSFGCKNTRSELHYLFVY